MKQARLVLNAMIAGCGSPPPQETALSRIAAGVRTHIRRRGDLIIVVANRD